MTTEKEMTAGQKYLASIKDKPEVIVDVKLPSGNVFEFAKPSIFKRVFEYGNLPQVAASSAVEAWIEQGVLKPGEIAPDQAAQIDEGFRLRDRVLDLSRSPKLVVGDTDNEDELNVLLLDDEDAAYLFAWVQAGGDESLMLGNFPGGRQSNTVAGNGSPKRRHPRK